MRADRLLSILLLLQARGRMTARRLAAELEVCERTIYRDMDALSSAGVPVYGERGAEGGYALVDSYRTSLTGLTEREAAALFMLRVPQPLVDLGLGQELAAALRKLAAALPAARQADEERVRRRFHLDAVAWDEVEAAAPHLPTVHRAVWEDRRLHVSYRIRPLAVHVEQTVDPYGLVAKAGAWHLVYAVSRGRATADATTRDAAAGGEARPPQPLRNGAAGASPAVRVLRVTDLLDARLSDESCVRPEGFDLAAFWRSWCAERAAGRASYVVTVAVEPAFVPELPVHFGDAVRGRIAAAGPPDARGRLILELAFGSLEAARDRLLGFGRAVEVLAPHALRLSMRDFAAQISALYQPERDA